MLSVVSGIQKMGIFQRNFAEARALSKPIAEAAAWWRRNITDGQFEPAIEKLFADLRVDYLQVHSTTAGCFTFRSERSTE
jgi:Protein of unknown function (DUF1203)